MKKIFFILVLMFLIIQISLFTESSEMISQWTNIYVINSDQFHEGYTHDLSVNSRIKFNLDNGELHYVGVKSILESNAVLEVASDPQEVTMSMNQENNFDINDDGQNDFSIKLNSISDDKVSITLKEITLEEVPNSLEENLTGSSTILCPVLMSGWSNSTNITKYFTHYYHFSSGHNVTKEEPFTFEKIYSYQIQTYFTGENCNEFLRNETNSLPFESIEPTPITEHSIDCSFCSELCEQQPPIDLNCGACICPENLGNCKDGGVREIINGTNVFCFKELLLEQKDKNAECQNHFECKSNLCVDGECEQVGLLKRLLDWFRGLFG